MNKFQCYPSRDRGIVILETAMVFSVVLALFYSIFAIADRYHTFSLTNSVLSEEVSNQILASSDFNSTDSYFKISSIINEKSSSLSEKISNLITNDENEYFYEIALIKANINSETGEATGSFNVLHKVNGGSLGSIPQSSEIRTVEELADSAIKNSEITGLNAYSKEYRSDYFNNNSYDVATYFVVSRLILRENNLTNQLLNSVNFPDYVYSQNIYPLRQA